MGKFPSFKYQTCNKLLVITINYVGCFSPPTVCYSVHTFTDFFFTGGPITAIDCGLLPFASLERALPPTAVYHYRWLPSRPPQPDESAPIQSAIWAVFSVPQTLVTRPGQDLSFVRMFFLILGDLQWKGNWGWCMAMHERGMHCGSCRRRWVLNDLPDSGL